MDALGECTLGAPNPGPHTFRLPGEGGAALFLRAYVTADEHGWYVALDIGLLSPDRLVHYLGRMPGDAFGERLADFLWQVGNGSHPKKRRPRFTDKHCGLTFTAVGGTDQDVDVHVAVIADLDADVPEPDGLGFRTRRAALVEASMAARTLTGPDKPDGE